MDNNVIDALALKEAEPRKIDTLVRFGTFPRKAWRQVAGDDKAHRQYTDNIIVVYALPDNEPVVAVWPDGFMATMAQFTVGGRMYRRAAHALGGG